jgi:hypothetical protein
MNTPLAGNEGLRPMRRGAVDVENVLPAFGMVAFLAEAWAEACYEL